MIGLLEVNWGRVGRSMVFSGWILNRWMHLIGCRWWVQYALNILNFELHAISPTAYIEHLRKDLTQPNLSKPTTVDEQTPKQSAQHLHFKDTRQMLREELATNGANSKSDMPLPHLSSSKDFSSWAHEENSIMTRSYLQHRDDLMSDHWRVMGWILIVIAWTTRLACSSSISFLGTSGNPSRMGFEATSSRRWAEPITDAAVHLDGDTVNTFGGNMGWILQNHHFHAFGDCHLMAGD